MNYRLDERSQKRITTKVTYDKKAYPAYIQEEVFDNWEKQDAVVRQIGIIGEAVRNVPDDYKQSHPEVAWQRLWE